MPSGSRVRPRPVSAAIAALAGRRIDAVGAAEPRFALARAPDVARKLAARFRTERVARLVCSAACGADILALEAAAGLGIPATIVLPFAPLAFRQTSVTDRPGEWGERFDALVAAAQQRDDLVQLDMAPDDAGAFAATNARIVAEAERAGFDRRLAFVVWEGGARGSDDATAGFLAAALARGFARRIVLTRGGRG